MGVGVRVRVGARVRVRVRVRVGVGVGVRARVWARVRVGLAHLLDVFGDRGVCADLLLVHEAWLGLGLGYA